MNEQTIANGLAAELACLRVPRLGDWDPTVSERAAAAQCAGRFDRALESLGVLGRLEALRIHAAVMERRLGDGPQE